MCLCLLWQGPALGLPGQESCEGSRRVAAALDGQGGLSHSERRRDPRGRDSQSQALGESLCALGL